uniref:Glucose-methanol-choline oxidoreductase N-terminal domain-containing protein n=1 Tax=Strigamia maritima TaxID=126957 RepID=T1IGV9_STRMM
MPQCAHHPALSNDYYACIAQQTTINFYHTVGTCSMGPSSSPLAVVDERLRVHGIKGLRVADASVIPLEITGNVNVPTVMVGERCADFIKKDNVGAGGAGSVVASRLSENPAVSVLLLEAGVDDTVLTDIPALAMAGQLSDIDWKYKSVSEDNANFGLCNRESTLPRGKVTGGSSALHYMMYVRGNKNDYAQWDGLGIKGWSYEENNPFFLKSENFQSPFIYPDSKKIHNRNGDLSVNYIGVGTELTENFLEAGVELGYKKVDYNGPVQTGYSYVQATVRNGTRCSSAKAFLKTQQFRPNLVISLESFVTKILIDDKKQAYGVEFEKGKDKNIVFAKKEVILSAGAYSSPQILMLSGVGPEAHLKEHKIPVIHNLPGVGQNMQDHVSSAAVLFDVDQKFAAASDQNLMDIAVVQYALDNTGPLSEPVGLKGMAFVNSVFADKSIDFPDIQLVYLLVPSFGLAATKELYNICDDVWDGYFKKILGKTVISFYPMLLRPKSRGEVKLNSADPHDLPYINPRMFTDEKGEDLKVMAEGIRLSVELTKTKGFKKNNITFTPVVMPQCAHHPALSNDYFACLAQQTTINFYHTVATCTMGPSSNPQAVVDERLRVHGIKGLRVADASVIPLEITGNVNVPTVMVGERCADFIKKDNVGAGGAGSVIANRLSENAAVSVLVLEAGIDDTVLTDIPALAMAGQLSDIDWKYKSVSEDNANFGLCNGKSTLPRGKVIGGSSALHYMMYVRGNRNDYAQWKGLGINGWSYEENNPFFLKSEDFQSPFIYPDSEKVHSRDGDLSVNYIGVGTELTENFLEAGVELGYKKVDYNGPVQTGYSYVQATVRNGTRCSSAKAFLKCQQFRPNLIISLQSFVRKILINDKKQAYGVEFEKGGDKNIVFAKKEVILSAGAYSSPQILMLSGVGPEGHLKQHKIPVIHNLPGVGQNMQDHVSSAAVLFDVDQKFAAASDQNLMDIAIVQYALDSTGPLSEPVGLQGMAFVNSVFADKTIDFPDIQLVYLLVPSFGLAATKELYNICDDVWDGYFKKILGKTVISFYPMLLRPKSRGEVKLNSADPHDLPYINPRMFTDEKGEDLKVMAEGIRLSVELTKTKGFKKNNITFTPVVMPQCAHHPALSNDYFACLAQQTTINFYHTVATCTMGPASNPQAVVDERLRVHGIKGLRVADASVIPLEITGNVNVPTVMVGERCADFIKKDN